MTSLKLPVITDGPVRVKATVRIGPPADPDPVPVPDFAGRKKPVQGDASSHKLLRVIFERLLSVFSNKKGVRAD
ncbi:MAG TPA: hypothetical protein DDZ65_11915 [Firmicutes bacterium]|mgnify:FL=1|nr:hypothetical protein [Bacillota bacterium]